MNKVAPRFVITPVKVLPIRFDYYDERISLQRCKKASFPRIGGPQWQCLDLLVDRSGEKPE
ncbi:MAG: hypothetical protein ACK451_21595 [Pseudanabaena sp.]